MALSCGSREAGATSAVRFWTALCLPIILLAAVAVGADASRAADKTAKGGAKSSAKSKSAAKEDQEDGAADEADLDMDDDLTALVVPASLRATIKKMDQMKFSLELKGLLADGMAASGDGLPAAKRHFEAAQRLVADDPRAAYAYAVVLVSQRKNGEALDQFRVAAKQSKGPYLPALQGIAWVLILKNDFAKGLPAVLDLAQKIEETKESWPTDRDRIHSAEWLGRMVGFLAGPGKPSSRAEEVEKLEAEIEGLLTLERKAAYEQGRKFVTGRHEAIESLLARPAAEIVAELKQKKQEVLEAAKAADAEVKQIEDELREAKKPIAKQVADLNQEMRAAAQKSKRATRDIEAATEDVEMYSQPQAMPQVRTMGRYRVPVVTARAENANEKKAREAKLAAAQVELRQAESALEQAKQEIADLKSQREQVQAEGRRVAAEKRPQLAEARHKAQDLAARARDIERGASTPEKLRELSTAVNTYAPLDPEIEKGRLLATLKTPG
jgi:hypothetical protein